MWVLGTRADSLAEATSAEPPLCPGTHHSHLSELEVVSPGLQEESPTVLLSAKHK